MLRDGYLKARYVEKITNLLYEYDTLIRKYLDRLLLEGKLSPGEYLYDFDLRNTLGYKWFLTLNQETLRNQLLEVCERRYLEMYRRFVDIEYKIVVIRTKPLEETYGWKFNQKFGITQEDLNELLGGIEC